MSFFVSAVTIILSGLTVFSHIAVALFLLGLAFPAGRSKLRHLEAKLPSANLGLKLGFLVALSATLGSLFYSEIAGYAPCTLCWYQRIALYPQVILLGLALWKHDLGVWRYSLTLSIIGALIAGYQYLLQLGVVPASLCSAVGSASCSQRFVLAFGYVTIPMMSLTVFVLLAIFALTMKWQRSSNANYPKKYKFSDIQSLQFNRIKGGNRNLSRDIDKIVYDL